MGKALSEMSLEELWELFPIILKEHNPKHKEWYLKEKENILKAVGPNVKRINHIGSSAVEGLVAKPIVDIMLEIDCHSNIENMKSKLNNSGWTLMAFKTEPEFRMSFNKGYTPNGFAERVFHLHVCILGDWDELYFRDYLMLHKEVAKEYEELKLELIKKYEHNRDGYTEAKTEFITKWTKIARIDLGNKYMP